MSCTCTEDFSGSATDLYNEIKSQIENNHGAINGDATAGTFSVPTPLGTVAGSYTIDGQKLTITISSRPILLGCGAICNYIKDHIAV